MSTFHAMREQIKVEALLLFVSTKDVTPKMRWTGSMGLFWMDVKFVSNMQNMEGHKVIIDEDLEVEIGDITTAVEDEGRTRLVAEDPGHTRQEEGLDRHEADDQGLVLRAVVHPVHLSKIAVVVLVLLHRRGPASHQREMVLLQEIENHLRLKNHLNIKLSIGI